jgi:hypothetical protein
MGITFRGKTTNDTPTVPRLGLAWLIRRRDPRSQRNPNPAGFGYGTAWGVGIVLSVLSLPIALCLTAWQGYGMALNVIWFGIIWTITAVMIHAVYRERHSVV